MFERLKKDSFVQNGETLLKVFEDENDLEEE